MVTKQMFIVLLTAVCVEVRSDVVLTAGSVKIVLKALMLLTLHNIGHIELKMAKQLAAKFPRM